MGAKNSIIRKNKAEQNDIENKLKYGQNNQIEELKKYREKKTRNILQKFNNIPSKNQSEIKNEA
jgi:hypothetical protein